MWQGQGSNTVRGCGSPIELGSRIVHMFMSEHMLALICVKNLWSCNVIRVDWRELLASRSNVLALMLSFMVISTPFLLFSVCVMNAWSLKDLSFNFSLWKKQHYHKCRRRQAGFCFHYLCAVISTISLSQLITNTFKDLSFFYTTLSFLFSLSSLAYHSLYSLDSPYTTAESQEPDCFHVLGFIAGFLPH